MGAFFIARNPDTSARWEKLDQTHRSAGFALAQRLPLGRHTLFQYRKLDGEGGLFVETDSGFACLTGQLLYRGATGEAALRLYCADLARDAVDHDRLIGQFALLLKKGASLRLFTDPLGFFQVYTNTEAGLASSSFWALLELQPAVSIDPAGVYEYAWNGATFGGKTFVSEIQRLPAASELVIDDAMVVRRLPTPSHGSRDAPPRSLQDYTDEHAERLRRLFADLATGFGDRLRVSFSSGFDSRLILAGLKAAGLKPGLFVYGQPGDTDVAVARQVAERENLSLEVIDKSALVDQAAALSGARQQLDLVRFDAWKVDGIFDDGVDASDRLARHGDGRVPLNGSLGEIYRNFFYIPDRRLALSQVVDSFFSTYAPDACTAAFSAVAYTDHLVAAFQQELGSSETKVARADIERLYPLVRGRYWTGRDVNLNLRFGRMFFPFMQAQLIDGTAEIPLGYKNHGRLEAKLIARLDPTVAAYPSGYGYRFCEPPPLKHRAKSWLTLFRPPWLRRYSYRLRFARPQPFPSYLDGRYLAGLMDASMPYMRRYFRPERLYDPDAFNRVAAMEYLFQRYQATETAGP